MDNFKTLIEQTISTNSLRFRYQTIAAIKQMQMLLESNDLGRAYHQCLKHANGSVFFILIKSLQSIEKSNNSVFNQNLKLNEIQRLLLKSNSSKSNNFIKEVEHITLFKNLKVIIFKNYYNNYYYYYNYFIYFFNIFFNYR